MTNVLIVDDEPGFAEFVADVVSGLGHKVETAISDADFSAKYSTRTEIVFLDLFMPGMDGIEVIRYLAETRSKAAVVLMSGHNLAVLNSARELAEERNIRVLGVLEKPVSISAIENALSASDRPAEGQNATGFAPSIEDIHEALTERQFTLVYQPQVQLGSGRPIGVETLMRWHHKIHGTVPPSVFIPVLETSELIGPATEYVIRRVCDDMARIGYGAGEERVSINLSARSIFDVEFPEKLERYVQDHGIAPSNIVLEVTETAVMSDLAISLDILARLRMKGFELSIDDFGIGYSSMEQLVRIPFSELKIDQKFVRNMAGNDEYKAVVEIATLLGHKLGMTVVAEGIEDETILNAVHETGCDEGQGFGIARPMPIDVFKDWLSDRHPSNEAPS